ncbi:MAG: Lipoprotein-releasing system ATP-binding protein LolD [Chlamydiia bacterium]|nr:Lipoprotein-releasing system ATP-binding protein LolD [Chlamydiia bacterium]MCH9618165.1 Lipoprotein-releasing system ATP-binding protein LolD [Chlamydiia bacterium]MCH9624475.1 Lipoprotein-releasing system ATP-binding protein LolD [Chlamydiia bacterium]
MKEESSVIFAARDIVKTFSYPEKVELLKGVSLYVSRGESVSITGPSGSGKSTILSILGTLDKADSGKLFLFGKSLPKRNFSKIRNKNIGFIYQNHNLLDEYTVMENLLIKAQIGRRSISKNSEAYTLALSLLEGMNLLHRKDFTTKLLSGGEKARVSIARAFMNDPEIILADEPTGNLDEEAAALVQDLLLETCKELNKSLIVVTHNLPFARQCDRGYSILDGNLTEN